jgi:hypothetical protein
MPFALNPIKLFYSIERAYTITNHASRMIIAYGVLCLGVWLLMTLSILPSEGWSVGLQWVMGFPLPLISAVQPIHIFMMGMAWVALGMGVLRLSEHLGVYLLRNKHSIQAAETREAQEMQFKALAESEKKERVEYALDCYECLVSIAFDKADFKRFDGAFSTFHRFQGKEIPATAGHMLIRFQHVGQALNYAMLVQQSLERQVSGAFPYCMALDWVPFPEPAPTRDYMIKLSEDAMELAGLQSNRSMVVTATFVATYRSQKGQGPSKAMAKSNLPEALELKTVSSGRFIFSGLKQSKEVFQANFI